MADKILFYEVCYKQRLSWTGKYLPVRFLDSAGFFIEGYLTTIAKMTDPEQIANVVYAHQMPLSTKRAQVPVKNIFPTRRTFTKLDLDKVENSTTEPVPLEEEDIEIPSMKTTTDIDRIREFLSTYPAMGWTIDEIISALDLDPTIDFGEFQDFVEDNLVPSGVRSCIMTHEEKETYKMQTETPGTQVEGETLDHIQDCYSDCTSCDLGISRSKRGKSIVFGRGDKEAKALIIGEAPGTWEEEALIPFHPHAPAGNILYRVMNKVGLDQDKDWYLTNAVICRPMPGEDSKTQNGKPLASHLKACSDRLRRTVEAVSPKMIVLLGEVAFRAYYGQAPVGGVTRNIGWIQQDPPVYLAFHPSYIARVEDIPGTGEEEKRKYLDCWITIAEKFKSL